MAGSTVFLSGFAPPFDRDASDGVDAALDYLRGAGGGVLNVDGMFTLSRAIDLDRLGQDRSVRFVGASPDSSGFVTAGPEPLVSQTDPTPKDPTNPTGPYKGVYQYHNTFEHLTFRKLPGSTGNIFDFRTGAQVNTTWVNLRVDHQGPAGSPFSIGPNHQAHGCLFTGLRVMITRVNPSPMFSVKTYHHGWNTNRVESSTFYGRGSTGSPAVELRPLNGGRYTHPVFESVTFQNTDGGAFHGYNLHGGAFTGCGEWDTPVGGMTRDAVRLGNGTSGFMVAGLGVFAYPHGGAVLAPGRHMVAIGRGCTNMYTPATAGVVWTGLTY